MRVQDLRLRVRQVQLVEQVVEVHAKLEFRTLAKNSHFWQAKGLAERGIDIEIARARERVTGDSRERRHGTKRNLAGRACCCRRIREQTSEVRPGDNCRFLEEGTCVDCPAGAVVGIETSKVGRRQNEPEAGRAVRALAGKS